MSIAVGVTCLFGFPATFIIAEEVSAAVSTDSVERDYLSNIILPKMLVGGFSTVTIGSVFVASFMVHFL
jgi:nitrate reductase gamma subunit